MMMERRRTHCCDIDEVKYPYHSSFMNILKVPLLISQLFFYLVPARKTIP
jgi:hypothetical protein